MASTAPATARTCEQRECRPRRRASGSATTTRAPPAHGRRGGPPGARPTSRRRTTRPSRAPRQRASQRSPPDGAGDSERHRQKARPDRDAADARTRADRAASVRWDSPAADGRGSRNSERRAPPRKAPPRGAAPTRANTSKTRHPRAPPAPSALRGARTSRGISTARRRAIGKPPKIDAGGAARGPTVKKGKFSLADHTFSGRIFECVAIRRCTRCRSAGTLWRVAF